MNSMVFRATRDSRDYRRLIGRHRLQIDLRPQPRELTQVLALTFRPGPKTAAFHEGPLRKLGTTALIAMTYQANEGGDRLSIPICGYRAKAAANGSVAYGGDSPCLFSHDGAKLRPVRGGPGAINVFRSPSIVETVLALDRVCKKQVRHLASLSRIPALPRIWLAFAPSDRPTFEDSPALRALAAQKLEMPAERLGSNGAVLLDRLLHDLWEQQWTPSMQLGIPGDLLLIDAEYCTLAREALEIYEDFSQLLGVRIWNPARDYEFPRFENPAREVLRRFDVDINQNFNQFFPDELIERFEQAMRAELGPSHDLFTSEEVLDGLTNPTQPLTSYSSGLWVLRARLPVEISECCTDDDLLRAARRPDEGLVASGACTVQVVQVPHEGVFTPPFLHRRIVADFKKVDWHRRAAKAESAAV